MGKRTKKEAAGLTWSRRRDHRRPLLCGEELPQAPARRHTSAVAWERPGPPCSRDLRLAARAWALGNVAEPLDGSALTQGRARVPAKGPAAAPPSPPAATGEPRRSSLARVAARREKRKEGLANSPGMATGARDSVGQSRRRRRRRPGPGKEEDRMRLGFGEHRRRAVLIREKGARPSDSIRRPRAIGPNRAVAGPGGCLSGPCAGCWAAKPPGRPSQGAGAARRAVWAAGPGQAQSWAEC